MKTILQRLKNNHPDKVNRYLEKAKVIAKAWGKKEIDHDYWSYIETILIQIVPKNYIIGD